MAKTDDKTTVLAFERKIDTSDAYLWQTNSRAEKTIREPITVREKSVRGTISNRLKNATANDPAKLDAEIEKANLQRIDAAFLNEDCDTLIATWTCKILPFTGKPSACNNPTFQTNLENTIAKYREQHGFTELAKRYATNIANARWLWRNRIGAETITITIKNGDKTLTIPNARELSLNDFSAQSPELTQLSHWITAGLNGDAFTLLHIEAQAKIGNGQETFPSQELILDTNKNKSKILYTVGRDQTQAGIHSQKIGNAIRTIDNWYPNAEFPIAAEPYGAVTTLGTAYRQPKAKQDFYSLFDPWIKNGKTPDDNQQHYIIAILIRGGVFGESGKE